MVRYTYVHICTQKVEKRRLRPAKWFLGCGRGGIGARELPGRAPVTSFRYFHFHFQHMLCLHYEFIKCHLALCAYTVHMYVWVKFVCLKNKANKNINLKQHNPTDDVTREPFYCSKWNNEWVTRIRMIRNSTLLKFKLQITGWRTMISGYKAFGCIHNRTATL